MGFKKEQIKRVERRVAAQLTGNVPKTTCPRCEFTYSRYQRVRIKDREYSGAPDVEHDWASVLVRALQSPPGYDKISGDLVRARYVAKDGQLPMVIYHKYAAPHRDDVVAMRLADFTDWFGDVL